MRIQIQDDNQNWLNWGQLVMAWITNVQPRPITVAELKTQLSQKQVKAIVQGADERVVAIQDYPDNPDDDPLVIMLPTKAMLDDRLKIVTSGPYPLPLFYDIAYAGAARANLAPQESQDFAARRIGEYAVQECC
jgi:hypothetical protein